MVDRPTPPPPPPSRGFLNDLFPVSPLEVAGGLLGLGTEGVGRAVAYAGSHNPLDSLTPNPSPAPSGVQDTANRFGHEITAMLDSPTHGGMNPESVVAAAPVVLPAAAKAAKTAKTVASTLAEAAAPVARKVKAPKDLPQVTWNPDTQTWEGGPVKGVPMEPPPHVTIPDIYDTRAPELAEVPPVPQVELPRYEPAKGSSQRVQDVVANPDVRAKMLEAIQRGKDVGMSWHNAQPAIQDAIDALGSEEAGRAAFKRYIDYNAATSSLNSVPTNAREASYYYWREKAGLPPPTVGETPPDPYHGGLANQGHQKAVNKILEGTWGTGDVSKMPSYGANLEGNLTPVAMDRHAVRAPGMLAEDPRWLATQIDLPKGEGGGKYRPQDEFAAGNLTMADALKKPTYWTDMPLANEYAGLEDYYQDLSREAQMAPGQGQASGWVGNAELTGVETDPTKTWLDMYQDRIKNTAYRTGNDPKQVVRDFWQGKYPLLGVGAPAALGGAAMVGSQMPTTPTDGSQGYDDWWQRLQNQQFSGAGST